MISDTIAAIATPIGVGGIGIIRISGPDSVKILEKIFKIRKPLLSHKAVYGKIIEAGTDQIIDSVLVLYLKGPKSFTGEDTVELHCHGNPYILNRILDLCLKYGARLSSPGEFTKRAFLNGKVDLTQAEAVYDLINSKTSVSLRTATDQMEGKLSAKIKQLRDDLIRMLSHIEAIIDFPDEIDDVPLKEFIPIVQHCYITIKELIATAEVGKLYREGVKIAIIGHPNVGKSSLLNALLRTERAIVTDIPGTTRDTLEEYLNIKGIPIQIIDTAGLRHTEDTVEKIGIERSQASIEQAQLVLLVVNGVSGLNDEEINLINSLQEKKIFILVINKIDLYGTDAACTKLFGTVPYENTKNKVFISAKYNRGIEKLEDKIGEILLEGKTDTSLGININNRHREILYRASESLDKALITIENNLPIDFLAIDIKAAIVSMGEIIGENVTEEVITEIFSNFCVGK